MSVLKTVAILNKRNIKDLLSEKLLFGNKACRFGVRIVEGFEFLKDIRNSQSEFNKNLFWYRYEDIFAHISVLWLAYFSDTGLLEDLQNHYFSVYKTSIVTQPLLSGTEIIKILNLKPSKQVGEIKERLMMAQLEGKIRTKEEAIDFIKNIII